MALGRESMPEQAASIRARNFQEVNLGFTQVLAAAEAERCLQCKNPTCIAGCPVRVNIPRFIELVADGDMRGAAESLLDDNALPCVTGRVCPQESQCEGKCLRGKKGDPVAIGDLERFVADWAMAPSGGPRAHRGGPQRSSRGHRRLRSGRPDRRGRAGQARPRGDHLRGLPRAGRRADLRHPRVPPAQGHRADRRSTACARPGVQIEVNEIIGKTCTLGELRDRFDAVFLAVGAGPAGLHGRARREPQGRLLGQRIPDAGQPDGRLP